MVNIGFQTIMFRVIDDKTVLTQKEILNDFPVSKQYSV